MVDTKFIKELSEFPLVCVGDAVSDWKKYYKGPIVQVKDEKELKEQIAYYSGLTDIGRLLVIEDISFVSNANAILLKFIEESKLPIVLLSRYDKIDSVLLSRIKRIEKYYRDKTDSRLLSCKKGQEMMESVLSQDSHYYDIVRYQGKFSPKLYYLSKAVNVNRVRRRILEFVD